MPSVSIIIATHSRPRLLPRAVESARAGAAEVVVVDDASADETAEVCRGLAGIRYVRVERNLGVAGARNVGILASRGEYLSFLDDDDVRLADSLSAQVRALEANPHAGLIYGQAIIGNQNGEPTGQFYPSPCPQGDIFWELLGRNFIPCGSAVFRRSCLYRVGLLDEAVAGIDDWDLWVRIAELYPVASIERPVMVWRRPTPASGQGSSRAAELVMLSRRQLLERWMRLPRAEAAPKAKRREAQRRFAAGAARHLGWESARALASGQAARAALNFSTALRFFPKALARVMLDYALDNQASGRLRGASVNRRGKGQKGVDKA